MHHAIDRLTRFIRVNVKNSCGSFAGTPILATVGDIDSLFKKGYVTKTSRAETDSLRYAICPVIEDPTDGGIAPDQFLAITLKTDGTPLEPAFLSNFQSLQTTGDWE